MVELNINGQRLELSEKGSNIKHTMRISDVFDVSQVTASYTNAFSIPKTPQNTQVLQQLGISGDSSNVPYDKVPANLKSNGYDIIKSGWLSIKETSTDYKLSIIDGMIDFFKSIENKTIGIDLDLSAFNHQKTIANVIGTMHETNTKPYTYIVADYNGENYGFALGQYGINIDYLIPCFDVRRIWDLIFTTFGYTYNNEDISFINGLYITYPLPPETTPILENIAVLTENLFVSRDYRLYANGRIPKALDFWSSTGVSGGATIVEDRKVRLPVTGAYSVYVDVESYIEFGGTVNDILWCNILKNGSVIYGQKTSADSVVTFDYTFQANEGDVIECILWWNNSSDLLQVHNNNLTCQIFKSNLPDVSLINAFKDFKIKDFFKEIVWRTGLTPVIDTTTKHIRFVTLSSRLDRFQAIDWSDKFVQRTKETYTLGDYAQKNRFRLKHDNEQDTSGDGFLNVTNLNLPDEKTIADSRLYAPETVTTIFSNSSGVNSFSTYKYKIWEKEPKQDEDGNVVIDYKGLSNRFYFVRLNRSASDNFKLVSPATNAVADYASSLPYASSGNTLFDETVYENYFEYQNIFTKFKAHDIELSLSITDVVGVDFLRPYYFALENSYYMLNALTWEDGKNCIGEFIRI